MPIDKLALERLPAAKSTVAAAVAPTFIVRRGFHHPKRQVFGRKSRSGSAPQKQCLQNDNDEGRIMEVQLLTSIMYLDNVGVKGTISALAVA